MMICNLLIIIFYITTKIRSMFDSSMLKKAMVTGCISAAGSLLLFGESGSIPVFGMPIPGFVVSGVTGGLSSILADEANKYVVPNIPLDKKFSQVESIAVHGGSGAVVFAGSTKLLVPQVPNSQLSTLAMFGGASVLLGDFAYHSYFNKAGDTNLF